VGSRALLLIGADSGLTYSQSFQIHASEEPTVWTVPRQEGLVQVRNQTPEAQRVTVDDGEAFTIDPGSAQRLRLRAGQHALVAVGSESHAAQNTTVTVRGAALHTWDIRPSVAYLRVINLTGETVELRKGDQTLGRIEAGTTRRYGPWSSGEVSLTAQGAVSRALYHVQVALVGGRIEAWELQPARGAVEVHNARAESIRVLRDGEVQVRIAAGESTVFDVPIGPCLIELIGQSTHAIFRHRFRVQPDRTYTVAAPEGPATLILSNPLPVPVDILIDQVARGTVAANGELRIPLARHGVRVIEALPQGEYPRQHRRITVDSDRLYSWGLQP
jgi:hypothetical protein